jgi:hypothetical protein
MCSLITSGLPHMDDFIIPECYLDTNLMETLVIPAKSYNHQKGCHTVAKVMQEKFGDSFALGILDHDKNKVFYLDKFAQIAEQHGVTLFKHPEKHHYLILHPPIESWLIKQAEETNLALADYELPTDLRSLRKITKVASSKNDHRFKRLFRDLKNQNADGIGVLKKWAAYLKEHPRNADINILQNL